MANTICGQPCNGTVIYLIQHGTRKSRPTAVVRFESKTNSSRQRKPTRLRESDDDYVRKYIYINPDLSPAEAKLAYEKRAYVYPQKLPTSLLLVSTK